MKTITGELFMLEAMMLICFGASWPASIYKSYKLKNVKGKSILFLWLVFFGYIFGFLNKVLYDFDWVTVFYVLVGFLVFTDIILYYRYSKG